MPGNITRANALLNFAGSRSLSQKLTHTTTRNIPAKFPRLAIDMLSFNPIQVFYYNYTWISPFRNSRESPMFRSVTYTCTSIIQSLNCSENSPGLSTSSYESIRAYKNHAHFFKHRQTSSAFAGPYQDQNSNLETKQDFRPVTKKSIWPNNNWQQKWWMNSD